MKFKYSKSNEEILNQLKAIYLYMSHLIHGQIERASEAIIRKTLNKSATFLGHLFQELKVHYSNEKGDDKLIFYYNN